MSLQIDSLNYGKGRMTIFLNGELDSQTSPEFERFAAKNIDASIQYIALDLKDLVYISSAGLRAFAKLRREAAEKNGKVVFGNLSPQVAKVFDIVKAIPLKEVFSSTEEMDAYLKNVQQELID